MPPVLKPTRGPSDWKALHARDGQWKRGHSARTLAYCWEAAEGFPPEIRRALDKNTDPLLDDLELLLAIPEFKVPLPCSGHASQNDIFVLARSQAGPVSIMVEGKVEESFGPTLDQWNPDGERTREKRLDCVLRTLGVNHPPSGTIRYQLLHRAASAILIGDQYRAVAAMILVHSFSQKETGWTDYQAFTRLFGVEAEVGRVRRLGSDSSIPLFGLWVDGDQKFLKS